MISGLQSWSWVDVLVCLTLCDLDTSFGSTAWRVLDWVPCNRCLAWKGRAYSTTTTSTHHYPSSCIHHPASIIHHPCGLPTSERRRIPSCMIDLIGCFELSYVALLHGRMAAWPLWLLGTFAPAPLRCMGSDWFGVVGTTLELCKTVLRTGWQVLHSTFLANNVSSCLGSDWPSFPPSTRAPAKGRAGTVSRFIPFVYF